MRIATIADLMAKMAELWPHSLPDAKRISLWEQQYRATLGGIEGDDLNNAWHGCMDGWKKKAAPLPADLLKAHQDRKQRAANDGGSRAKTGDFMARLADRDKVRVADRQKLIADYQREHADGYQNARKGGWVAYLDIQVQRSANMIAQRNEQRKSGKQIPGWTPEYCEGGSQRAETFYPWFSIVTTDDVDRIEIDQQTLKVWRNEARIVGPTTKRLPSNGALERVGMQAMEVTSDEAA